VKSSLALLLAFAAACSSAVDPDASTPPFAVRVSAEAPPRWPEEYPEHFVRLRAGGIAITAGAEPSSDHAAGTVYVIEALGVRGEAVSEWDLATGTALRRRELPFALDDAWPRILHRGQSVHVVASSGGSTHYMLLDNSFRMVAWSRLAELGGSTATVASDGTLTLVLGGVPSYDGAGAIDAFAATFDAHGKRIAGRQLGYGFHALGGNNPVGNLGAVVGGTPYILRFDDGNLRLHELTPDLQEVISTIVPAGRSASGNFATLGVRGDRLVVDVPREQQFEYSLDLTQVREVPRRPPRAPRELDDTIDEAVRGKFIDCWQSATTGSVYALLCMASRHDEPSVQFIAWDRER
jgi:hypothetical protein